MGAGEQIEGFFPLSLACHRCATSPFAGDTLASHHKRLPHCAQISARRFWARQDARFGYSLPIVRQALGCSMML